LPLYSYQLAPQLHNFVSLDVPCKKKSKNTFSENNVEVNGLGCQEKLVANVIE